MFYGLHSKVGSSDSIILTDDDRKLAADALAAAQAHFGRIAKDACSDFEWNVKVSVAGDSFDAKIKGYLAFVIPWYIKETSKVGQVSGFVGAIKDKLTITAKVIDTKIFSGTYGQTYFYSFQNEAGNVFVWFSSKDMKLQLGSTVDLKGMVKDHKDYQGLKQTVLTRCTIVEGVAANAVVEARNQAAEEKRKNDEWELSRRARMEVAY
jgi:hypothetical protein